MKKQNQDKIFLKLEGNKYFRRNGAQENKFILNAVKLLKPSSNSSIIEIGCGSGKTLKKIKSIYKSKVFGIDTQAKQLITQKKYNLKNVKFDTFLNFKTKKKYDIVIDGGFLYVTPDNIINQTFKKIFKIMKINSYFIFWDYDTPYSYTNKWKYNENVRSFKRDYLKLIYNITKAYTYYQKNNLYLKQKEVRNYNKRLDFDKIMTVMIFKKIS